MEIWYNIPQLNSGVGIFSRKILAVQRDIIDVFIICLGIVNQKLGVNKNSYSHKGS